MKCRFYCPFSNTKQNAQLCFSSFEIRIFSFSVIKYKISLEDMTERPTTSKGKGSYNLDIIDKFNFGDEDLDIEELSLTKEEIDLGRNVVRVDYPCIPDKKSNVKTPCAFSNDILYAPKYARSRGFLPFTSTPDKIKDKMEFLDYLEECPIYVLKAGTTIVHTTHSGHFERIVPSERTKYGFEGMLNTKCWWSEFLPGTPKSGGGWFTFGTSYGGPEFGLYLYYKILRDTPILYIKDQTKYLNDSKRFKKSSHLTDMAEQYTGSHLIQGPPNWERKGYQNLHDRTKYFADGLGERLAELGFNGYISCDECEVFLSHNAMKNGTLTYPYRIDYNGNFKEESKGRQKILNFITQYCAGQRQVPLKITTVQTRDEAARKTVFERNLEYEKLLVKQE
jgi:hypothetical protein